MDHVITEIRYKKRDRNRVDVYINEELSFSATLFESIYLKKGTTLGCKEIAEFQEKSERHRAYSKALNLIGYKTRTRLDLKRKLSEHGFETVRISETLDRLECENLIDDREYARIFIESRRRHKPASRFALIYELKQKGIGEEISGPLLENYDDGEAAWDAIRTKLKNWQFYSPEKLGKKINGLLKNRGFGYGICKMAASRASQYINEDTGDNDEN